MSAHDALIEEGDAQVLAATKSTEVSGIHELPTEQPDAGFSAAKSGTEYAPVEQDCNSPGRDLPLPKEAPPLMDQPVINNTASTSCQSNQIALPSEIQAASTEAFTQAAVFKPVSDDHSIPSSRLPLNTATEHGATCLPSKGLRPPHESPVDLESQSGSRYTSFQELRKCGLEQMIPPPSPGPLEQSLIQAIPPLSLSSSQQNLPPGSRPRVTVPLQESLLQNIPPHKPVPPPKSLLPSVLPYPSVTPPRKKKLQQVEPTWPRRTKVSTRALPQVPPSRPFWLRSSRRQANDPLSLLEDTLSTVQEQGQRLAAKDRKQLDKSNRKRSGKVRQAQSVRNAPNAQDMDGSVDSVDQEPLFCFLEPCKRLFRGLRKSIFRCFRT